MGDSVHGDSRFNREVVAHPSNAAPVGRLMLHCLQLLLPTLPDAGSNSWRNTADTAAEAGQLEVSRGSRGTSEKTRLVDEDSREPDRGRSAQEGTGVSGVIGCASVSDGVKAAAEPEEEVARNDDSVDGETVMDGMEGRGLEVYAEPPGDMMAFLRRMSWWEEGMIEAAERTGRRPSPPPPLSQ